MKIAVNALFLVPGQVGGTEIYLRRTLCAMPARLAPDEELLVFANAENAELLAADLRAAPRTTVVATGLRAASRVRRVLFENRTLPRALAAAGADVLWNPGNAAPLRAPCPQATTVHDMQYRRFPEDFAPVPLAAMRLLVPAAVRRSARTIAVSEFSRSEILSLVPGASPERVVAVPEAADPLFDWTASPDERLRYFSGAADYVREGAFPAGVLDLGEVRDVAEVRVDGVLAGTLAYRPYRIEVPAGRGPRRQHLAEPAHRRRPPALARRGALHLDELAGGLERHGRAASVRPPRPRGAASLASLNKIPGARRVTRGRSDARMPDP